MGTVLLAVLYENIAGNESFSLPCSNIFFVTVVGTILSICWGWFSTLSTLAVYALFSIIAGVSERRG